jgi:hypothetical protein
LLPELVVRLLQSPLRCLLFSFEMLSLRAVGLLHLLLARMQHRIVRLDRLLLSRLQQLLFQHLRSMWHGVFAVRLELC